MKRKKNVPQEEMHPLAHWRIKLHEIIFEADTPTGKAFDILRVIDFLAKYGWKEVHLASRGWGTLPAGFAALLDDRVKTVTLKEKLESWHSIAVEEHYEWPLSHMIFGALEKWDLPDVWKALEGKIEKG